MSAYDVPDLPASPAEDPDYDRAVQRMLDECPMCDHVVCDVTLHGSAGDGLSNESVLDLTDDTITWRAIDATSRCRYLEYVNGSKGSHSVDSSDGTWTVTLCCTVSTPGYIMDEDAAEQFVFESDDGWEFDKHGADEDFEKDVADGGFAESVYLEEVAKTLVHMFTNPWRVSDDVDCDVVKVVLA